MQTPYTVQYRDLASLLDTYFSNILVRDNYNLYLNSCQTHFPSPSLSHRVLLNPHSLSLGAGKAGRNHKNKYPPGISQLHIVAIP
jgi:hypothetical protein